MRKTIRLLSGLTLAAIVIAPVSAEAATRWQRHHPARTQVNHRIAFQQARITHERRQGDITAQEAHALRKDVHAVRMQERAYARSNDNHGHLTRAQVRDLNQQLDQTSRAIGH